VKWFLGVRVIRDRLLKTINLVHDAYIDKIAKKFSLAEIGSFLEIPLAIEELLKSTGEALKQEIKSYQERVRLILYTAIMLWLDIAYTVSKLSHYLTNPSVDYKKAADYVIVYLFRTRW
jgi:hypothetical protein